MERLFVFLSLLGVTSGIMCWSCQGLGNNTACMVNEGNLKLCESPPSERRTTCVKFEGYFQEPGQEKEMWTLRGCKSDRFTVPHTNIQLSPIDLGSGNSCKLHEEEQYQRDKNGKVTGGYMFRGYFCQCHSHDGCNGANSLKISAVLITAFVAAVKVFT